LSEAALSSPNDFKRTPSTLSPVSRVQTYAVQQPDKSIWYFIHDEKPDGKAYFVGYDSESKHCIGYLGLSGFSQSLPNEDDRFPVDGSKLIAGAALQPSLNPNGAYFNNPCNTPIMISGNRLLKIDLRNRSIKVLMESPELISLALLRVAKDNEETTSNDLIYNHSLLAVRMTDRIILFNASGKQVQSYVIPKDLQDRYCNFWRIDDEKAIISESKHPPKEELTWIDPAGKVLRQEEVALEGTNIYSERTECWHMTLIIPEPVAMASLTMVLIPLDKVYADVFPNYKTALERTLSLCWPMLLTICILSAVLAFFCYRRQRRMAQPWTWVWVGFVFLCGVPGFLGYLFHRRWPVMEKCPACGNLVPHDRNDCSSCGTDFPLPELKGIEVFA
jgi:hypothetical protein